MQKPEPSPNLLCGRNFTGFGKTLAAYFLGAAAKRFNVEGVGVRFALIASSSLVCSASISVLFTILQRPAGNVYFGASLVQALVTGGAGVVILSLVDAYLRARANRP